MPKDINLLPMLTLPSTSGAPNPTFAEYMNDNCEWVKFNSDPKYPWRNFHELNLSSGNKYRMFLGFMPGVGQRLFRVLR